MAFINVAEWSPENVAEWLKGLDDCILPYVNFFLNNNINGCRLLLLSSDDLANLNMVKIGHQELVLDAVDLLKHLHYNFGSETLQSLALRLGCKARSLFNQLKQDCINTVNDTVLERVSTTTLSSVSDILAAVKQFISWIDRFPFEGQDEYIPVRKTILRLSIELASTAQRDQFVDKPNEVLRTSCLALAELCDRIVQELCDSLAIQPATLDVVTVKKKPEESFGMHIHSSYSGIHIVGGIKFQSPAHRFSCMQPYRGIEEGDEIIQVNYQTVVGWQLKKLVNTIKEYSIEILLTMKKRPRHSNLGQIIVAKPHKLPSRKVYRNYGIGSGNRLKNAATATSTPPAVDSDDDEISDFSEGRPNKPQVPPKVFVYPLFSKNAPQRCGPPEIPLKPQTPELKHSASSPAKFNSLPKSPVKSSSFRLFNSPKLLKKFSTPKYQKERQLERREALDFERPGPIKLTDRTLFMSPEFANLSESSIKKQEAGTNTNQDSKSGISASCQTEVSFVRQNSLNRSCSDSAVTTNPLAYYRQLIGNKRSNNKPQTLTMPHLTEYQKDFLNNRQPAQIRPLQTPLTPPETPRKPTLGMVLIPKRRTSTSVSSDKASIEAALQKHYGSVGSGSLTNTTCSSKSDFSTEDVSTDDEWANIAKTIEQTEQCLNRSQAPQDRAGAAFSSLRKKPTPAPRSKMNVQKATTNTSSSPVPVPGPKPSSGPKPNSPDSPNMKKVFANPLYIANPLYSNGF